MGWKRKQLKEHDSSLAGYSPQLPHRGPTSQTRTFLANFFFHISTPSIVQSTVFWVLRRVM